MTTFESWSLLAAYLNLIASFGGLGLLYYGIRVMARGAEMRAADSERKHNERMAESRRRDEDANRRHDEWMRKHDEESTNSRRRHEERMTTHAESRDSLRALIDGQAESRMALRELIERTG